MVPLYITMEALSDMYGWTPEEIMRQDPVMLDKYMAIIAGKNEAQKAKGGGSRKLQKEIKKSGLR